MSMIIDEPSPEDQSLRQSLRKVADGKRLDELYDELVKGAATLHESETLEGYELFPGPSLRDVPRSMILIPEERNIAPILLMRVGESFYLRAEQFLNPDELAMHRDEAGQMLDEKLADRVFAIFKRELSEVNCDIAPVLASEGVISVNARRVTAVFNGSLAAEQKEFVERDLSENFPGRKVSVISKSA